MLGSALGSQPSAFRDGKFLASTDAELYGLFLFSHDSGLLFALLALPFFQTLLRVRTTLAHIHDNLLSKPQVIPEQFES